MNKMRVLSLVATLVAAANATRVIHSNVLPQVNTTGDIMDAHDGTYNQWTTDGPWYYYAMGYGTCKQNGEFCHSPCGYGYSWIGVWKSDDMSNGTWTLVREARDDTWPKCTYFRVHTIYNKATKLYVMWVNLNGGGADYAVGTSSTPDGPFTFVHKTNAAFQGGGDFDILVDDDSSAFLIYTATRSGHVMSIDKLSDDYLTSLAAAVPPPPPPPGPYPPMPPAPPGFIGVGQGACRDANMKEPGFWTNEDHPGQSKVAVDLAACEAACAATQGCGGIAYCNDEGTGQGCFGECHIYGDPASKPPSSPASFGITGVSWHYEDSGGGKLPITRVTSEPWWDCYVHGAALAPVQPALRGPVALSVSVGAKAVRSPADEAAATLPVGTLPWMVPPAEAAGVAVRGPSKNNVSSGVFGNEFVEAPAFFKRKGVYYALFGNCCCFCASGSGIGVYTATAPLGPYTYHDNVGCTAPVSDGCGCGMNHRLSNGTQCNSYGKSLTKAQQNFVIQVPDPSSPGSIQYVWTGDMWQSAADGIKAHDLQYWSVLEFDDTVSPPLPKQFVWEDTISFNA